MQDLAHTLTIKFVIEEEVQRAPFYVKRRELNVI